MKTSVYPKCPHPGPGTGGSLAKVAYMSEVRNIRKRHYSFSSPSKSDDEDHEKVVSINFEISLNFRMLLFLISKIAFNE